MPVTVKLPFKVVLPVTVNVPPIVALLLTERLSKVLNPLALIGPVAKLLVVTLVVKVASVPVNIVPDTAPLLANTFTVAVPLALIAPVAKLLVVSLVVNVALVPVASLVNTTTPVPSGSNEILPLLPV